MVNRKEEQGDSAISDIKKEKSDAQVEWKHCDMGNLNQIKNVFTEIRNSLDRLDFLVLSAGINTNQYGTDSDGIDRHFGVNWLGHFYVCNQLWPLLRKTGKLGEKPAPRVVFEASEMHRGAPPNVHFASLEEINNPDIGPTQLYGRTKLAMILGAKYGLRDHVIKPNSDNIYALSVHPGAVSYSSYTADRGYTDRMIRSTQQCNSSGKTPTPVSLVYFSPTPCSPSGVTQSKVPTAHCGR